MDNFNVTENPRAFTGKESQLFAPESVKQMQADNSFLLNEKGGFKKPLPQGFPDVSIDELQSDKPDFSHKKKQLESLGDKKDSGGRQEKKEDDLRREKKEDDLKGEKKEEDLRQEKKDGAIRQEKKESSTDKPFKDKELSNHSDNSGIIKDFPKGQKGDGLTYDPTKTPVKDGGIKDSVNSMNSGKTEIRDGGPKDKPAALNEDQPAPEKVPGLDGGPKDKILGQGELTPVPDKVVNLDGGEKGRETTFDPGKVESPDGGPKDSEDPEERH